MYSTLLSGSKCKGEKQNREGTRESYFIRMIKESLTYNVSLEQRSKRRERLGTLGGTVCK